MKELSPSEMVGLLHKAKDALAENINLKSELTQLAIESKNRDLLLAKLEAEVLAIKPKYLQLQAENETLRIENEQLRSKGRLF